MTIEELSNGLHVDVSIEAYVELDALYLKASEVYNTNACFIEALRDKFATRREREWLVRTMERIHELRNYK